MAVDPDQVRVDLLRVKRKIYISYPEGSQERKEFMIAAKMSELSYLQNLAAPDMMEILREEYDKALKAELYNIGMALGFGASLGVMLFGFHQLYPNNVLLGFWYLPIAVGFALATTHVYHIVDNWRRLQPFKQNYQYFQDKIAKLLKEIKGLAK